MFQGIEDIERFQREVERKIKEDEYSEDGMLIKTADVVNVYFLMEQVKEMIRTAKEIEGKMAQ